MFFSGMVERYSCTECEYGIERQSSTAFMYWLGLIAIYCAISLPIVDRIFGKNRWHLPLILVGEVVALVFLVAIFSKISDRKIPSNRKCPQCSGDLKMTGRGFFDGLLPSFEDLLVGLALLVAHIFAIALMLKLR